MKRLVLTITVVLFCSAVAVQAVVSNKPFVSISVTPDVLDLGTIPFAVGSYDTLATLTVKVESNCFHGPIAASITNLKHNAGYWIKADRIYVNTPATGGFVSMAKPVVISEPTEGSHNIKMNFRIDNKFEKHLAGRYTGSIILTIMPLALP